jgi:hypothetical protein
LLAQQVPVERMEKSRKSFPLSAHDVMEGKLETAG